MDEARDEPEDEVVNTIVRRATSEMAQQGAELVKIDIDGLDDQLAVAQLVVRLRASHAPSASASNDTDVGSGDGHPLIDSCAPADETRVLPRKKEAGGEQT